MIPVKSPLQVFTVGYQTAGGICKEFSKLTHRGSISSVYSNMLDGKRFSDLPLVCFLESPPEIDAITNSITNSVFTIHYFQFVKYFQIIISSFF